MTLSYNELVGNTEQSAILGRALNTVRCPSCGAHTVYLNAYGDEWCFSCEWFEWGEESYQGKSPALGGYPSKLVRVTLKCAKEFHYLGEWLTKLMDHQFLRRLTKEN